MDNPTLLQFLVINFSARDFELKTEQGLLLVGDERWSSVMGYTPDPENEVEFIQTTIDFIWGAGDAKGSIVRWDYPGRRWEPDFRISTKEAVRHLKSEMYNDDIKNRFEWVFLPYKVLFPMDLDLFK